MTLKDIAKKYKIEAKTYTVVNTKAAANCVEYILEHEAEDYFEQAEG